MGYSPTTRSGHNMFVMASMLQKAIRRGDPERAGYAAYELFGGYDSMLWKRLLVISSEDCWGILTKEIVMLQEDHRRANEGLKAYSKNPAFVSEAVTLLCEAKKSRDACYYACNFILSNNAGTDEEINLGEASSLKQIFSGEPSQGNLFATPGSSCDEKDIYAWKLYNAIRNCDMENSGYAAKMLLEMDESLLWTVLLYAAENLSGGSLNREITALRMADGFVNKKKAKNERDPIFIAKSIMNLMYFLCGEYASVLSVPYLRTDTCVVWSGRPQIDISRCQLPGNVIPEYVYDVHTIEGKRAGKTDWGMNLVENDALKPFQPAFFETGSWELRYDYKHEHGICTEREYQMSLEYRKTHEANPAKKFLKK